MIELLKNIWYMIELIGTNIGNILTGTLNVIRYFPDIITTLLYAFAQMPTIFSVAFSTAVTIAVLYVVAGR